MDQLKEIVRNDTDSAHFHWFDMRSRLEEMLRKAYARPSWARYARLLREIQQRGDLAFQLHSDADKTLRLFTDLLDTQYGVPRAVMLHDRKRLRALL